MKVLHVSNSLVRSAQLWMTIAEVAEVEWDIIVSKSELEQVELSEYAVIVYEEREVGPLLRLLVDSPISEKVESQKDRLLIVSRSPKLRHMGYNACLAGERIPQIHKLLQQGEPL